MNNLRNAECCGNCKYKSKYNSRCNEDGTKPNRNNYKIPIGDILSREYEEDFSKWWNSHGVDETLVCDSFEVRI